MEKRGICDMHFLHIAFLSGFFMDFLFTIKLKTSLVNSPPGFPLSREWQLLHDYHNISLSVPRTGRGQVPREWQLYYSCYPPSLELLQFLQQLPIRSVHRLWKRFSSISPGVVYLMRTAPEFIRGIWVTIKTENRFNGFLETQYTLYLRTAKVKTDKSVW